MTKNITFGEVVFSIIEMFSLLWFLKHFISLNLHCAVDAEAVEVEVLLDVALDDAVEVNKDDVVALFDPDPGFPVNDIISVLDKWIWLSSPRDFSTRTTRSQT